MAIVNRAYDIYNQASRTGKTESVPRHKFTFIASLDTVEGAVPLDKILSVTMPSWSSTATTMNAYNAKRVVQTGYDYTPITLIAYDTRDPAALEQFLKKYSAYYFDGPMNINGPVDMNFKKGFKLQQDRNYIKTLTIVRQGSKTDINEITIYNPVIQSIDADTLDYSDSSLVQYRIQFIYEGYSINTYEIPGNLSL